ncbi:MAG: hypothetical protein J0H89_10440, partial [Rhizobiales bacterium]|nr:hypothetical protein [Hyphomicrobiales bacterium]
MDCRRQRGYDSGMARPAKKKSKPSTPAEATLALAVAQAPRLVDAKAARARLDEWLSSVGRGAAGKALKRLLADQPKVDALLLGLADGSPYLWDLATAKPDRLLSVLNADPDPHFATLLQSSAHAV